VHPRHPYVGDLVFTAFSGSHQDAIKKGLTAIRKSNSGQWEVPYLPIDPADVGRTYEAVIRINSQSGKGGVAYVLENDFGLELPRRLQMEFSGIVQKIADKTGKELSPAMIWESFEQEYLERDTPFDFISHTTVPDPHASERRVMTATIRENGVERKIEGKGNGPIDAYLDALRQNCGVEIKVANYHEHSVGVGADATAVAYMEVQTSDGRSLFGVGRHNNIVAASLRALTSAANRAV
jgi:2-isopropylmalate synthase